MNFHRYSTVRPLRSIVPAMALALASLSVMSTAQAESRFIVSADGQEVTDTQTKLVWQRCTMGQKWDGTTCTGKATKVTLAKAKELGSDLTPAMRLPTKDELVTIVDKTQKKPAIDKAVFPGTPSAIYLAARTDAPKGLDAWLVDFKNGKLLGYTHKANYVVRLVRAS